MTLRAAADIRDRLMRQLDRNPTLQIELGAVDEVDLSGIQLLLATRQSAEARGGALTLASAATGPLLAALTRGGFLISAPERAFWLRETP